MSWRGWLSSAVWACSACAARRGGSPRNGRCMPSGPLGSTTSGREGSFAPETFALRRSPEMVRTPLENVLSTSSRLTPASSTLTTRSSPLANTSAVETQAVAWVPCWSSCPGSKPCLPSSRARLISLVVYRNIWNGVLRFSPVFLASLGVPVRGARSSSNTAGRHLPRTPGPRPRPRSIHVRSRCPASQRWGRRRPRYRGTRS